MKQFILLIKKLSLKIWRKNINSIKSKFANISFLILDVDGVLTDGSIYIDSDNKVHKKYSVKDGLGIKMLQENGIEIVLISGGSMSSSDARAEQLGIKHRFFNVKDKRKCLIEMQRLLKFDSHNCAYVGDDLNDIPIKSNVSLFISPNDAVKEVKNKSDLVLSSKGGKGAIREISEIILKSKKQWNIYSNEGFFNKND